MAHTHNPPTSSCPRSPKKVNSNKILEFFANCPDNAFQRVRPGTDPFTVGQRFGAIARNGAKLLGVGFFASLLGECGVGVGMCVCVGVCVRVGVGPLLATAQSRWAWASLPVC